MVRKLLTLFLATLSIVSSAQITEQNQSYASKINSTIEKPAFRKNNGQWDKQVLYRLVSGETSISFYKNKIQFGLRRNADAKYNNKKHPQVAFAVWDLIIDHASEHPGFLMEDKAVSKINYFKSSTTSIDIEESSRLVYQNIYPNIDLIFYLNEKGTLKYDFKVKPGGDINDIQLTYDGIKSLKKDRKGNLIITAPWGNKLKEGKPISWQTIRNKKETVDIDYVVNGKTLRYKSNSPLKANATLTIDPVMLDWSTYFYGTVGKAGWGYTWVMDMDVDKYNNVYVTGFTTERFPLKVGTYDTIPSSTSGYDGFVAKMSVSGDSLLYFTYIGGTTWSYILSIAVNSQTQPVISGFTYSKDYPVTSNAFDKSSGSGTGYRGFITKFSSDLKTLVFSTFFGNSNSWGTVIQAMALTANGDVIFTGNTNANDLPVTSGCYQSTNKGANDAFLTRLSADGSKLIYSTYFGGNGDDKATDLSVNAAEDVYIVGSTTNSNMPVTVGAQKMFKNTSSDMSDGFVARIQKDGKVLQWCKVMGGSSYDYFEGLFVNSNDELYIAGYSNSGDFWTTANVVQPTSRGGYDHVIVKMNKSGTNLYWSTYLGGSGDDYFYAGYWWTSNIRITANVKDEAIIGGITKSYNYPITADALQPQNNSKGSSGWNMNVAITKLNYDATSILYGTYFGGSDFEWPTVLKVKKISCMSSILYGGITVSKDYPTTKGVFKEKGKSNSSGWTYSGFMSRFRDTLYTEPINFKGDFIECDLVYEVLDAKNRGADYLWNDNSKKQYLIIGDTGKYWVRATYGCDTVSDTIRVKLEMSPQLNLPADTTLCNNVGGLNLDAKNDSIKRTYLWNTGNTTKTVTLKKPGTYSVTVKTPHCGEISDTTEVKFLKIPGINNIKDSVFCDQINWLVKTDSLGPNTKYNWSTGDTFLTTKISKVGNYRLKVSNYCGEDSVNFKTSLLFTPKVSMPNDTIVCNTFSLKYKVGKPNNEELYNWYDPLQKVYYGTDDSVLLNTTALLGVVIENRCGIAKDSVLVLQKFSPVINLGNDSIYCNSINKILSIGKTNNMEAYFWKGGNTTSNFTITGPGKYWASIKNLCGQVSDTVEFTQKNSLTIDLGRDSQFCDVVSKTLNITQPDPDAVYQWHDATALATFTANTPGKVYASITNLCGTISDTAVYTMIVKPKVDLGKDYTYCDFAKPVSLTVGQANNNEVYKWSDGNLTNANSFNSAGKYWVDLSNKCGLATDTFSITVVNSPTVNIGPDTSLCGIFSLPLIAVSNPGLSYLWEPTGETTQNIVANRQTIYKVTVTDASGCFGSDELEVKDDCKSRWYIPNAFSPNGDNINDEFEPHFLNCENYSISIFNTWGEKVYESTNILANWDGTYLGREVPTGNFSYVIHFKSSEDKRWYLIKGVIAVVR